ncbi:MAG: stage III sporulation protein AA, partial [Anaeromassilibacillus sp.]
MRDGGDLQRKHRSSGHHSINIRIARQVYGCASAVLQAVGKNLREGVLIAGAPASGKTTILRDMARQLSSGLCGDVRKVAVVDERGELAGTYRGVPQNDLGPCCDVLDGYPKGEGILQAIRSLSPEFIICDELGGLADVEAAAQGLNAGVGMISSVHAGNVRELLRRQQAVSLLHTGAFGYVVLLEGSREPGRVAEVYKA